MRCPHCDNELTAVYRGLVATSYVSHPVEDGRVNLDATAVDLPPFEEEFEDGSHGVTYLCPHCRQRLDLEE